MKRIISILFALALVLAFSLVATTPVAAATTYYVATTGNDGNTGGSGDPWLTIQYAIDHVISGDTINVAVGTYTITSTINVNEEVTITGDVANPGNVIVQYSPADITQSIFEITASNVKIEGIKTISGRYAVGFNGGSPTACTISHCILDQPGRRGVSIWSTGGNGHTIEYTTISNVGPSADADPGNECGIYIYSSPYSTARNIAIEHNTFTNMYRGVYHYSGNSVVIDDNEFTHIKDQGHSGNVYNGGPAIDVHNTAATGTADRVEITNNTISDVYWQGIMVYKGPYTYISNNTLSNCNYYGSDGLGDWDYAAIHVQDGFSYGDTPSHDCIIDNNTVYDSINGIQVWSPDCQVTCNEIYDMGKTYADTKVVGSRTYKNSGILIGTNFGIPASEHDPTGVVIQNNSIHDNYWGLFYSADLTNGVTAENNWWGDDSGPSGNGPGSGDAVSANVDYDPWITASSIPTATGTGTASFVSPCGSIINLTSVSEGSLPTAGKPNLAFPHGFFSFDITGLSNGQTVTVTITLPPGAAPTQYWKYHASEGGWIQIPMTVVGPPNVIRITLVDGGLGDDDGLANGVIVDQGAPASGAAVGWETYPVSKVRVLLPWIALLAAIVAGASLLVLRRRRAQT